MLAVAGEKTKACKYVEIGRTAHLLPEEKLLIDRAEAAFETALISRETVVIGAFASGSDSDANL